MVTVDPIKIERRRREIADEIARLQKEAEELDIALKVLARMGVEDTDTEVVSAVLLVEPGAPRPSGIPTTFEMLEAVLCSAEKERHDGLTAREIVDEIRNRFWPGLTGNQILPSVYRFLQQGRVKKTAGGKFKRLRRNEGSEAVAAEPSGG